MNIKHILQYGKKLLTSYQRRFDLMSRLGFYNNTPDDVFLKKQYKANRGKELNIENPQTFNEKLQWIKLYERKPLQTIAADKYEVRKYVKEKIGEEYLVPLLGVWDSPDEIDFDALPDSFVLKCNHNSGTGMCICKDKSRLNIEKVKKELQKGLDEDFYLVSREWQYKNIKRKIIAEKFLKDGNAENLLGYKIYCFNGEPKLFSLQSNDGAEAVGISFLDIDWNVLPVYRTDHLPIETIPEKPSNLDTLLEIAKKLSEDFTFMRVDLYSFGGKIYFSELTMTPCSGYNPFVPEEWDRKIGEMLKLPEKN